MKKLLFLLAFTTCFEYTIVKAKHHDDQHHTKAKRVILGGVGAGGLGALIGGVAGGKTGAAIAGPVGFIAGSAIGAAVDKHKNRK